jgi:tripartite-type tricarboxylate transporter receptor subunit TctC
MPKTQRGFAFRDLKDSRGNRIRVQESSAAGGPFAWLFVRNAHGEEVYMHTGTWHAVSPHLTRAQARRLAKALMRFADGDTP